MTLPQHDPVRHAGQARRPGRPCRKQYEVRGWWRYHHLFADLLQARLREEQPDQAAQARGPGFERVPTRPVRPR